MKASTRFFCWILAGVMFCAVSLGGCGGDGSSIPGASNTTSEDIAQPVSGDTSGGRGGSGWDEFEDVAFEYLNGTWEIEYISMTANPSGVATGTEIDLFCNLDGMPQLVFTTSSNNELTIKTLDGRTSPVFTSDFYGYSQTYGQVSSKGIAIIAGGQYTMIADNTYRQTVSNQNYYMLKGKKGTGTKSSQWKYVEFTNVYNVETDPLNSFKVTTVLTPAQYTPLGDYEIPNPIELLNNTVWRIAHSEVSPGPACKWTGVTDMGVFDIDEKTFPPYVKFSAAYDALTWGEYNPDNPNQNIAWSYIPMTADFKCFEPGSNTATTVNMPVIVSAAGYTIDASSNRIFSTPMYDSSGKLNADREMIQVSGTHPWDVIKFIHRHYDTSSGALEYEVITTLETLDDTF